MASQRGVVTSFRKKVDSLNIRGTRISLHNSQLLTSTGSATLDFFLGGGLAIGTICLIEEDCYNTYSNVLLKYFLAEGVANNHSLFLSSGGKPSKSILKELPSIRTPELKSESKFSDVSEDLKIAWRYKNQTTAFSSDIKTESQNHGYDLSKTIPDEVLEKCSIFTWDPEDTDFVLDKTVPTVLLSSSYSNLLEKIKSLIANRGFSTTQMCENIMRISICALGSPLWNSSDPDLDICRFLFSLRSVLRTAFAVAVITLPSYLMQNKMLQSKVHQICDTVICLESFVGSDKKSNALFKEFDGLLQVVKLPVLNTFVYPNKTSDLAFKLKRKNFLIERLHLPPDFEEPLSKPDSLSCSGQSSKLDF